MDTNSWMRLNAEAAQYRLPEELRAADPFSARDCGWVEQMRPFVTQLSRPGECVLDPFCGFGTTLLAAALEGRRGLGFEVDAARVALTRRRLQQQGFDADLRQGSIDGQDGELPAADFCLTSVPYFGCNWPAAAEASQLYVQRDYASYLRRIGDIFHRVHGVLAEGRYCVVMAENLVLGGRMLPLAWDLGRLLSDRFELLEERILVYDRPAEPLPSMMLRGNRSHEYALVFRKARTAVDLQQAAAVLRSLATDGFVFAVHGSFARWLRGEPGAQPADADLLVADDEAAINRLLASLAARGFAVTSWGEPVLLPLQLPDYRGRYYFRARRVDRAGACLQLDIGFEADEPLRRRRDLPLQWRDGIPLLGDDG